MRPPPPAHGPPPEGRDWRGRQAMEEPMRLLTIAELMRLTRGSPGTSQKRPTGLPGRFGRTGHRSDQPAQHPPRAREAGLLRRDHDKYPYWLLIAPWLAIERWIGKRIVKNERISAWK